jgi:hypothetical protein
VCNRRDSLDNQDVFESVTSLYLETGMRTNNLFVIDSHSSGHCLSLDGGEIGKFRTLNSADAKALDIARLCSPTAPIHFALDFKWTLSEVEIRTAAFPCPREGQI